MLRLLEVIIGVVVIYVSLDRLSSADKLMSMLYGLIAVAGLILAVHGILLYNVPDFFARSM